MLCGGVAVAIYFAVIGREEAVNCEERLPGADGH